MLENLPLGTRVADFSVEAVYLDDAGRPMGARWVHVENSLPVTVLSIQSVPQVFLHVNTPPVSDRGEPHTGEHLLLGKGMTGRGGLPMLVIRVGGALVLACRLTEVLVLHEKIG